MEAETPRGPGGERRPAGLPPDDDDDGGARSSTQVRRSTWEAGARPERRKWKKAETPEADLDRQDGAAPRRSTLGAERVTANTIKAGGGQDEWEAVEGQEEAAVVDDVMRKQSMTNQEEAL